MPTEGTPIELKDIKPGDVVRAEWQDGSVVWMAAGPVLRLASPSCVIPSHVIFAASEEEGDDRSAWCNSTYYLISRPEKVIDKEDLKLGQRVRIEAGGYTYEGEVAGLYLDRPNRRRLVNLDKTPSGAAGSVCVLDAITKVVLLS